MSGRRMDIARHALLDSVQNLDPRTAIRLVFFHTKVKVWNEKFLVANAANKASAKSAIERLEPEGETNFHGAIKAALGLLNKDIEKVRLDAIPDTVLFLTDGRPTKGEITSMPELLSWFEWVNRFARVELHVIALGDLNIDAKPLERLAEIGGGSFIHVRESGYGGVGHGVQGGGLDAE